MRHRDCAAVWILLVAAATTAAGRAVRDVHIRALAQTQPGGTCSLEDVGLDPTKCQTQLAGNLSTAAALAQELDITVALLACMNPNITIESAKEGDIINAPCNYREAQDFQTVFTFGPDKSGIPGGATEADVILYLHNNVRENFPDLKPLTWSTDLAASALKIAETCPLRESDATPYGESVYSMATTDRDAYNFLIGVIGSTWYSTEVLAWDPCQNRSRTQQEIAQREGIPVSDVPPVETRHFTQLVWKTTTEVGCATNYKCKSVDVAGVKYGPRTLVCLYNPKGNVEGEYAQVAKRYLTPCPGDILTDDGTTDVSSANGGTSDANDITLFASPAHGGTSDTSPAPGGTSDASSANGGTSDANGGTTDASSSNSGTVPDGSTTDASSTNGGT